MSNLDETRCPLCGTKCTWDYQYTQSPGLPRVTCSRCGTFIARKSELEDLVPKKKQDVVRLSILLYERRITRSPRLPSFLVFSSQVTLPECLNSSGEPWADPLNIPSLLATWPEYPHDQLDRALLLLSSLVQVGRWLPCWPYLDDPAAWFAEDREQLCYIRDGLIDLVWLEIETERSPGTQQSIRLTLAGWRRVEVLTRTRSARVNPVFVARWFGKPDRTDDMERLCNESIFPAIDAAGYQRTKADTDDYNTGIMDKVLYDIRRAPFVVADFTNHNLGVYYEVGFAVGEKIDVIPCCPEGDFREKHFDIAHVNIIKYKDGEDLRQRLERRILGSIGAGPFRNGHANK